MPYRLRAIIASNSVLAASIDPFLRLPILPLFPMYGFSWKEPLLALARTACRRYRASGLCPHPTPQEEAFGQERTRL